MKIAISSCLAGNHVRYDGRDKLSALHEQLIEFGIELVTICPEVGIGLSVPRSPIHLVKKQGDIRVTFVNDDSKDVTEQLINYAESQFDIIKECSGYITAQRSPSCGFESTAVLNSEILDSGIFIQRVALNFPDMPISDEQNLLRSEQLKQFLNKVSLYQK